MGTLYKTTCKSCNVHAKVNCGDGMFFMQFQCFNCKKLFNIPRKAPRQNRYGYEVPEFLKTQSFTSIPPTPIDKITRFSDENLKKYLESPLEWQKGDDDWDEFELKKIHLLVTCKCDAVIAPVSSIKEISFSCQRCGLKNLEKIEIGTSD